MQGSRVRWRETHVRHTMRSDVSHGGSAVYQGLRCRTSCSTSSLTAHDREPLRPPCNGMDPLVVVTDSSGSCQLQLLGRLLRCIRSFSRVQSLEEYPIEVRFPKFPASSFNVMVVQLRIPSQSFLTPSPVSKFRAYSSGTENIGTFLTDEVARCDGKSQGSFPSCWLR